MWPRGAAQVATRRVAGPHCNLGTTIMLAFILLQALVLARHVEDKRAD